MERFLGDWGLKRKLRLPVLQSTGQRESIGVIGSGPAGLSFAYQMARRGYPVTIYDEQATPGGMLRHEIPDYRLPEQILASEIQSILDLGIAFEPGIEVGKDITLADLRARHRLVFLGIGAQRPVKLGIPGEEGPGVWSGIEYLRRRKHGQELGLGARTAVIGGGNTAFDAARMARRDGAEVVLFYRRTRAEMPAIAEEIDDAAAEGVRIEFLASPKSIVREGDGVRAIVIQKMALGEPDDSGRCRPVPVPGAEQRIDLDTVIVAVSQEPGWVGLDDVTAIRHWLEPRADGRIGEDLWAGGDDRGLGIAGLAIAQGRQAAQAAHAELRGLAPRDTLPLPAANRRDVKADFYGDRPPMELPRRPVDEWLRQPSLEVSQTIRSEDALAEANRCLSCGLCIGCQQCWMYCNAGGFVRLDEVEPGAYFALSLDVCEGCGKCIDVCPTGFLSPRAGPATDEQR